VIYLDHAATTHLRPQAWEAMSEYRGNFGNPSGVHETARRAKNAMEDLREEAAAIIGAAHPLDIIFTGGGTEADNLAVKGTGHGHIVATAIEHKAVLESAARLESLGVGVTYVPVDESGRVDPDQMASAVTADTTLVSVMQANNETGAVQPVAEVAAAVRSVNPRVLVHTDAVQAFISEPVDVGHLGVDMVSLAAHKFGGPKGVGLLYARQDIDLQPVVDGGGQELGKRSGTHNPMGIAGMVAAMRVTQADRDGFRRRVGAMRDQFEEAAQSLGAVATTPRPGRLVQHSHLRFPGMINENLLIGLDRAGVAAAAGSACQSGAVELSHVLAAMGFDERRAGSTVRFSFGWSSEPDDAVTAAKILSEVVESLR
jgi:cysteine desulfurase